MKTLSKPGRHEAFWRNRISGQGNGKCKGTGAGWYAAGLSYSRVTMWLKLGKQGGK